MYLYFYCFSDETIHVAGFCGKEFGFLQSDFKISSRIVQGDQKFFPWLQTFITRKLHVASQLEEFQPWIIFQQDGTPPRRGSHVRRFLDAKFPNRWIGRDGPTPWPPRSPDITNLDFFLWGYVKDKVFSTPVPDDYKFEGKNNRRFCFNNWKHVGEHVERNWL